MSNDFVALSDSNLSVSVRHPYKDWKQVFLDAEFHYPMHYVCHITAAHSNIGIGFVSRGLDAAEKPLLQGCAYQNYYFDWAQHMITYSLGSLLKYDQTMKGNKEALRRSACLWDTGINVHLGIEVDMSERKLIICSYQSDPKRCHVIEHIPKIGYLCFVLDETFHNTITIKKQDLLWRKTK